MFDEAVVVEVIFSENCFDLLLWSEEMSLTEKYPWAAQTGRPTFGHKKSIRILASEDRLWKQIWPCPKEDIGTSWLHGPLERSWEHALPTRNRISFGSFWPGRWAAGTLVMFCPVKLTPSSWSRQDWQNFFKVYWHTHTNIYIYIKESLFIYLLYIYLYICEKNK